MLHMLDEISDATLVLSASLFLPEIATIFT